jgi:hypothetical protein
MELVMACALCKFEQTDNPPPKGINKKMKEGE